jgi:hypothetical protein
MMRARHTRCCGCEKEGELSGFHCVVEMNAAEFWQTDWKEWRKLNSMITITVDGVCCHFMRSFTICQSRQLVFAFFSRQVFSPVVTPSASHKSPSCRHFDYFHLYRHPLSFSPNAFRCIIPSLSMALTYQVPNRRQHVGIPILSD